MSAKQSTITASGTSKIAVAALALVFVFGLFVVGFDQGHIFSLVTVSYTHLRAHET